MATGWMRTISRTVSSVWDRQRKDLGRLLDREPLGSAAGSSANSELADDPAAEPIGSRSSSRPRSFRCRSQTEETVLEMVLIHPVAIVYDLDYSFSRGRQPNGNIYP